MHAQRLNPVALAVGGLWALWVISWLIAAPWSARAIKTIRPGERRLEVVVLLAGAGALLYAGTLLRAGELKARLYSLGDAPSWLLVAVVACGFALCWWARIYLGRLWSIDITLKEGHQVIDTGPYALVRHPIYTGVLISAWATAAVAGMTVGFLWALLGTLAVWLKARREEQLLTTELGAPYEVYRCRVPMLLPRIFGTPAPR